MKTTTYLLIFIILLSGCSGTRKVEKSTVQVTDKSTEQVKQNTETKTETKTDTNILSELDEINIEPIDNTKPVTINGNTYTNARIKATKSKVNTTIQEDKKEDKKALKDAKIINDTKEVIKDKQIEREDYSGLVIMGIAVLIIIGYLYFKFK